MILSLTYGLINITIQSLLIRELIAQFTTNELVYGIFISTWLIINALGSLWSSKLFLKKETQGIPTILILLSILSLLVIPWLKFFKPILGLEWGVLTPNWSVIVATLTVFIPAGLLSGILFNLISRYLRNINTNYLFEGLGYALGGILFSLVLAPRLTAIQISLLITLTILVITSNLFSRYRLACSIIGIIVLFGFTQSNTISKYLNQTSWQSYQIIQVKEAHTGRLTLLQKNHQKTLFINSSPYITVPNPIASEETLHLPLAFTEQAQQVLILGTNNNLFPYFNTLRKNITMIEPDKDILKIYPETISNIKVLNTDPRSYLTKTNSKYDLIILNLPPPTTIQTNRFYTTEFFKIISSKLSTTGLFALQLPYGENLSIQEINQSVYASLQSVFQAVKPIHTNNIHYLAANTHHILHSDHHKLKQNLKNQDLQYFDYSILDSALGSFNVEILKQLILPNQTTQQNSDNKPQSYYLGLNYWQSLLDSPLQNILKLLKNNINLILGLIICMILLSLILPIYNPSIFPKNSIPKFLFYQSTILTAWEIMLLQLYQTEYGFLYHHFPILFGIFMLGLSGGTYLGDRYTISLRNISLATLLYSGSLVIFIHTKIFPPYSIPIAIAGVLLGISFSSTTRLYQKQYSLIKTSSILYATDLSGGILAPIILSIILIPIVGFTISGLIILLLSLHNSVLIDSN